MRLCLFACLCCRYESTIRELTSKNVQLTEELRYLTVETQRQHNDLKTKVCR